MDQNTPPARPRHKEWTGIFLIIVGGLMLLHKLGVGLPYWIFTWPMLLIGIGLLNGFQHNFRNATWFILIIIGSAFLLDEQFEAFRLKELLWPGVLILVGIMFIVRRKNDRFDKQQWKRNMRASIKEGWKQDWKDDWEKWNQKYDTNKAYNASTTDGEYIDSTNIFGGTKKVVLSKNFRGGDITCFFGGAEIDFSQADMQSPVILDLTMVFGGAKITVPSHWDIKNQVTPVFGSIEDKRTVAVTSIDPNKTLVLTGAAVFGGIEIRNF